MAKSKYIKLPDELWQLFDQYATQVKENPIKIQVRRIGWTAGQKDKNGNPVPWFVELPRERPLTLCGFSAFLSCNGITTNLRDYLANSRGAYEDFAEVCGRIKRCIYVDQIEGAMVGVYNARIVARYLGLKDSHERTVHSRAEITIVRDQAAV